MYILETWNNAHSIPCYIDCFNRKMELVFKDFDDFNQKDIMSYLTNNYYDWMDDDKGYCCEEYILANLPTIYKDNLICVIYDKDEEDDI